MTKLIFLSNKENTLRNLFPVNTKIKRSALHLSPPAHHGDAVRYTRRPNRFDNPRFLYLWSFLLPILAMLIGFLVLGIFPFGGKTTLAVDLRNEYVGFYESFRASFSDPSNFFYDFSKSLGGEMVGTYAYYMMSPFNLLFFVFPKTLIPVIIEITQLLKIGLSGLFFSVFLVKQENGRGVKVILFSLCYALLSFSTANMLNHMWLDPIMIFPLVLLGLERMIRGKSPLMYVLALAFAVWTNYYIAFMMCIFLCFYFVYAIAKMEWSLDQTKRERLGIVLAGFWRFALYSILAVGVTSIMLLPNVASLIASKGSYADSVKLSWTFDYPPLEVLAKFIPAAFNYDQVPTGYPNVFAGTLTIVGTVLYFLQKRIKVREKLVALFIVVFLILSMNVKALTVFWHGMQYPVWYEYRFSWVFSFFIVYLTYRAFSKTNRMFAWKAVVITTLYALMIAYLALNLKKFDFLTVYHLIGAGVCFLLLMILLALKNRDKKAISIAILVVTFLELTVHSAFHTGSYNYETQFEFENFTNYMHEAADPIKPEGDDFYRIEKLFMHDNNDAMRIQFYGISHFNSALERRTVELLNDLGFAVTKNSVNSTNATKFTDAFFGVRYYLAGLERLTSLKGEGFDNFKSKSHRPDLQSYSLIRETPEGLEVYENSDYMPLGILAESGAKEFKSANRNPMDLQEALLNLIDGRQDKVNYFKRLPISKVELDNVKETSKTDKQSSYSKLDKTKSAKIDYTYRIPGDGSYYLSVSNHLNKNNASYQLDGKNLENKTMGTHRRSQVYNVADGATPGENQTFTVKLKKDQVSISNISLFELDEAGLKQAVEYQRKNGLQLEKFDHTHIIGTVTATKETPYVLFTFPFDKGWSAYVDGEEVETMDTMDAFFMIPVTEGEHQIELKFTPHWLKEGAIATAASILILGVALYLNQKNRKKNAPYVQK